jgi:hypothetical protein
MTRQLDKDEMEKEMMKQCQEYTSLSHKIGTVIWFATTESLMV